VEPCIVRDAAYMPPTAPGFSIEMKPESLTRFRHRDQTSLPPGN
jgi:L-fuconate dehydratase